MILFINTTADPRNASAKLVDALRGRLFSEGYRSILAHGRGESPQTDDIRIGDFPDLALHTLLSRLTGREGEGSRRNTIKLLKQLDRLDISLVHLHNLHGHYLNMDLLTTWLRVNAIPVILTLHDCWTITPRCATFLHNGCRPDADFCRNCRFKKEYPAALTFSPAHNIRKRREWFSGLADLTVAGVSEWITGYAMHSFQSRDARFITIPNGVDTSVFHPSATSSRRKKTLLAAAANWEPSKGLDKIIRLSEILPEEYQLNVIGNLMGHTLPTRINHIGSRLSPNQMAEAYNKTDILLFPAAAETFGMILAEAQACGIPAIAQDIPASKYILGTRGGILTDFSDPEKIISAIMSISSSEGQYIPQVLDIKNATDRYMDIYRQALNH